ncbi:MAG: hypothetical protein HYU77_14235 [Betaproteobacteria bacterium]|nr:hypothetical protein [Betaproteobacteria bacterium]
MDRGHGSLLRVMPLHPAEPLWKRVPRRDDSGRAYSDFMMLIPGLSSRPAPLVEAVVGEIERVLARFGGVVVFADLNLNLNVLWVTVKPGPNVGIPVAAAILARVPEARLVAPQVAYR